MPTTHCELRVLIQTNVLHKWLVKFLTIFRNSIHTSVRTYKIRIQSLLFSFGFQNECQCWKFPIRFRGKITFCPFYRNQNVFILSPFTHVLTLHGGSLRLHTDTFLTTCLHKENFRRRVSIPTKSDSETSRRIFSNVPTASINSKQD